MLRIVALAHGNGNIAGGGNGGSQRM